MMTATDSNAAAPRSAPLAELRLLGAPQFLRGGVACRLPRKSIAVLAYVALAGRVTRAKLAGVFWGELDNASARRNLRRELHRLGESGADHVLDVVGDSLALAGHIKVDVTRFESLLESNVAAALALYNGPFVDGIDLDDAPEFSDWLTHQRERLANAWRRAMLAQAAAHEAAGQPRDAIALVLRLIAEDPLQELHYAAAMRLYQQVGERVSALSLYERCRTTLTHELGLEPLPDTAALAERIRSAEHLAPLATVVRTAGLAPLTAPLVGRAAELDALRDTNRIVVLVVGAPGVGKSRLVDEHTLTLPTRLKLAASELGRNTPLDSVVEALAQAWAEPTLRARLQALNDTQRADLALVLPAAALATFTEMRGDSRAPAPAPAGQAAQDALRVRFLDSLSAALCTLANDGAIWFDDLQWVDALTLDLLQHLAHQLAREQRSTRRSAPRIVVTARTQELGDHADAQTLVLKLERAGLLHRMELAPLSADATAELVRRLSGSEGGAVFAQRLQRTTDGNPFFLLETIRFLFDSGDLTLDEGGMWSTRYDDATSDYAELPVPPTVQQAVIERVERLGPAARRVLETAALVGDRFVLEEVQPATALSDWEALDGLERALHASVLVGAGPNYRFAHDLARSALDAKLGPERRRLIHLRLADTLEARRAAPGRIAIHLESAGRAEQAVPWRLAAARAAEAVFAYREALEHYRAALVATATADRIDLHRARLALLRLLHDLPGTAQELDAIEQLGRDNDRPAFVAEVLCGRAALALQQQRYAEAAEFAEQALQHPAFAGVPEADRDRALLDRAFALVERARYDEARAIYDRELAASAGRNAAYRAELHYGMANLLTSFGDDAPAREHLRLAVDLFGGAGNIERRLRALSNLAYTEHTTGDTPAAIATMHRALADAERLQLVSSLRNTLTNFVAYLLIVGDIDQARAMHQRAVELLRFADDPATRARLQMRQAEVSTHTGDLGGALVAAREAVDCIEQNGGGIPDFWPWRLLGRLLWWCGDSDAPVRMYQSLRHSPAYLPTAEAPIKFYSLVLAITGEKHQAKETASALVDAEPAPGMGCESQNIDFWRAYALNVAGEPAAALALLEPDGGVLKMRAFGEHPGRVLAARVVARGALGIDVDALRPDTEAVLRIAPAPVALELAHAWTRAAPKEARWRTQAKSLAQTMHDSLAADPKLQSRFRERWRDVLT